MNVFDFAMNMERSGSRFYRQLAEKTDRDGPKTIFTMMANDEEKLIEKFRAMRTSAQAATMEDSAVLENAGNIFEDALDEGEALKLTDDLAAYDYVMKVERGVCQLYEEAAARETDAEVKGLLLKIADEERGELDSLQKVYDFVNAPNEYLAWREFSNEGEFHNFGRDED